MGKGIRRHSPALLVACVALFAALGGTVYAATKIDGKTIKVEVAARQPAGARLAARQPAEAGDDRRATAWRRARSPARQIDAATLGQVPSAVHADNADSARDAQTALHAVNAARRRQGQRPQRRLQATVPLLRRRLLAEPAAMPR